MIKVNQFSNENFVGGSTSAFNFNKNWQWVDDMSGEINVFVDHKIKDILTSTIEGKKYGWLLESRTIIPDVFDWVEKNISVLEMFCDGIFTCDEQLAKNKPFIYTLSNAAPWIIDKNVYEKTKLVSMISSNKSWSQGHQNRLRYVEKFKDHVDFYGRGFNTIENKLTGLKDYMFSIAIENYNYDDYFTEKITDCFATGTIPIFWGTKNVSKYFDPNGIIFLDDNFKITDISEEIYYEKMNSILYNFEISKNFSTSEDFIYEKYLKKEII